MVFAVELHGMSLWVVCPRGQWNEEWRGVIGILDIGILFLAIVEE